MKRMGAAAVLAAALLLSGCGKAALPYAREMGDMALLRTMGVDAEEEAGQVRVTVSTGKRAAGLQGESQPPLWLRRLPGGRYTLEVDLLGVEASLDATGLGRARDFLLDFLCLPHS